MKVVFCWTGTSCYLSALWRALARRPEVDVHVVTLGGFAETGCDQNLMGFSYRLLGQELKGVQPDRGRSHHSEYFSRSDLWSRRSMGYVGALIVLTRRMGVEPLMFVDWILRRWIPSQICSLCRPTRTPRGEIERLFYSNAPEATFSRG